MAASSPPLQPGEKGLALYDTLYKVNLGKAWKIDGADWRLIKAAAALTTCGRMVLVTAVSGGLPTYVANTTTTANNGLVVGVLKSTQVDLAIGDYALVQVSGFAEVISAAAIADKGALSTSTTAGRADDLTATVGDTFGYAIEAAAGAAENVACRLCNLV